MSHPTEKRIGRITISVDSQGYPYWTRIHHDGGVLLLSHEEARDLHYAMQRIVAFLDVKQESDRKNGFDWR